MTTGRAKRSVAGSAWRLIAGAAVGAAVTLAFLELVGPRLDKNDPGTMLALVTGLCYALMGVMVGLGTLFPSGGAQYLNVENAEELRDESPLLKIGTLIFLLVGAFFLILAISGGSSTPGSGLPVYAAAACLVGIVAVGIVTRKRTEEMMRQMSLEASSLTLQIVLVLLACAALVPNSVGELTPLAIVSGIALLHLIALFVAIARKGMLTRR
jgi:O-antigen/teichoic acid export membrane protein